jgi:hypothetical protein
MSSLATDRYQGGSEGMAMSQKNQKRLALSSVDCLMLRSLIQIFWDQTHYDSDFKMTFWSCSVSILVNVKAFWSFDDADANDDDNTN